MSGFDKSAIKEEEIIRGKKVLIDLEKALNEKMKILQFPDYIFFTSWTFAQSEGRMVQTWEKVRNKLKEDKNKSQIMRIWSFVFPEMREDYFIERTWKWMTKQPDCLIHFESIFFNSDSAGNGKDIFVSSDFLGALAGKQLNVNIAKKIQAVKAKDYKTANELDLDLKRARLLKYDTIFNKTQIEGIDKGFSMWVKSENLRKNINKLFKSLYGKKDFTENPIDARKFLTMWQNLSVISPAGISQVLLAFYHPHYKDYRYSIAFFYKHKRHVAVANGKFNNAIKAVFNKVYTRQLEVHNNLLKEQTKQARKDDATFWMTVKKGNEKKWRETMTESLGEKDGDLYKLDNLMEVACELTYAMHEARPCRFTFIAGTEQIWPAVEEIVSLDFFNKEKIKIKINKDCIKPVADLCEANYSIFQTNGIVAFYNIQFGSMNKIVRLRYPSIEELRQIESPISDTDDFFCWTIRKIYNGTDKVEKPIIVSTQENGKVLIYGVKNNKVDLLLIWNVGKGKLYKPISDETLYNIKKFFEKKVDDKKNNDEFNKLINVIRKISAIPGEGACLIITGNQIKLNSYLATMELLKPSYLETLGLDDPHYLLKAAFIMDGACLITRKKKITPRLGVYPHSDGKACGLLESLRKQGSFTDNEVDSILDLAGKGSKTNLSVNLTTIPAIKNDVCVISISADGAVKVWPKKIEFATEMRMKGTKEEKGDGSIFL